MDQRLAVKSAEQILVRLPDGMRREIKISAAMNNRSMNAEVVAQLVKVYQPSGENKKADARA